MDNLLNWIFSACFGLAGMAGLSGDTGVPAAHHVWSHQHHAVQTPGPETPGPSDKQTPPPMATQPPAQTTEASLAPAPAADTCPGSGDVANTVAALTCLTNQARTSHGLKPVADSQTLLAAATAKAQDMQNCGYGHTACGHPFQYEMTAKGYRGRCYGENIAYGQGSPSEVFQAWMNSPEHRANILKASYRDLGVAEAQSSNGPLWVMELGGC